MNYRLRLKKTLVIEDSPAGVEAALNAGMHVIAVTTPFTKARIHQANLLDSRWIVDDGENVLDVVRVMVATIDD